MDNYVITTDNGADLPNSYYEENEIGVLPMSFMISDRTYPNEEGTMEVKEFYHLLRAGQMSQTFQTTPIEAAMFFENYLKAGKDVLHLAFSSALSGTYNNTLLAAQELTEKYPERQITIVDSRCASLGEGLLVYKAVELKNAGKAMEQVAQWTEDNKLRISHLFTVDDLFHLYRGGRVTKATAFVGSVLNVKPLLQVDNQGKLVQYSKVRGRKHSLKSLVDDMEKSLAGEDKTVFISHGDCPEDAGYAAELIREQMGVDPTLINEIGPSIGTHSGPGTVAIFFFGRGR